MTAIVGLVHDGAVHIGGDSAGVAGWTLAVRADAKVFRNGPYLCGFTTSFRMGQLIQYGTLPKPTGDLHRFMATTFIDALRDALKAGGWAERSNEREAGGEFLVGVSGRLFTICGDYQVGENADGYAAVGVGHEIALGSLYSTAGTPAKRRVRLALEAAERHNIGVRGPFVCKSTRRTL